MSEFKKIGDDREVLSFLKDIQSLPGMTSSLEGGEDESDCPYCDGYGYIVSERTVKICSCLRDRKDKRRIDKANIPPRYKNKTLDNFKADIDERRLAIRQVRRFVDEFDTSAEKPGLFLYGAPGTGKTHLAVGAIKELLRKGYSVLFYNAVSLMEDFRRLAPGDLNEEDQERLERLMKVDVLVLDDLGAGKLSEFVLEKTYSLIDKRYSNNQCLIVSSNKGMKELESLISYPVFSRVRGMCHTVMTGDLDFRNPDLQPGSRRKPAAGKKGTTRS